MGFEISSKIKAGGITLNQLQAQVKGKYQKEIASIFNQFNTKKTENGEEFLDQDEQMRMLGFFKSMAGTDNEDTEVTRKSFNHSDQKGDVSGYKGYKRFMEAFNKVINGENTRTKEVQYSQTASGTKTITTSNEDGTITRTNRGEFIQETIQNNREDGAQIKFTFTSEDPEASPSMITMSKEDKTIQYDLQENGLYQIGNESRIKYLYQNSDMLIAQENFDGVTTNYEYPPNSASPSKITQTNNDSGAVTEYAHVSENKYTTADGKTFEYNEETGDLTEVAPAQPEVIKPQIEKQDRPTTRIKVPIAKDWKNQRLGTEVAKELNLNDLSTAEEVLDKILTLPQYKDIDASKLDKAKILEDLTKYNPSVFDKADGNVWKNANWARLDFPPKIDRYILQ